MNTLRALVKRDEAAMQQSKDNPEQVQAVAVETPKVSMKDFRVALTKVLPSVSKRDELLYKSLEGSLRKSRSNITNGKEKDEGGLKKPTPMKY